jgi:hypothetical protein
MPQLHEWAKKHPDVPVLWLNAATEAESLRFVSELGATLPVAPYTPESKMLDKYKVRVTPFIFMVDEVGVIRAKGLVNNKSGLDLYYRELKTGKFEPIPEDELAAQAAAEAAEEADLQEAASGR